MNEYTFTGDQLNRLLAETIELYLENVNQHGQTHDRALAEAVLGVLDGLDAEQELSRADTTAPDSAKVLGHWTFTPARRIGGQPFKYVVLNDEIMADEAIYGRIATYVRGNVSTADHQRLYLSGWHKATRS